MNIGDKELNDMFEGVTCHYYYNNYMKFPVGNHEETTPHINISTALRYHLNKTDKFIITKIELTEENKKRLYEYIISRS